jgi:ketosteroid isomerase-like protein
MPARPYRAVRSIAAALLLCAAAPAALAKMPTAAQIMALQKQYVAAYVGGDTAALAALLDDQMLFVHGNGKVATKDETLAALGKARAAGASSVKVVSITVAPDATLLLNPDWAVLAGVNQISIAGTAADGTAVARVNTEYCSYLWTLKGNSWRITLIQSTVVQPPAAASPSAGAAGAASASHP